MLRYAVPPGYRREQPVKRPKLGPWLGVIDAILEEDKTQPPKQRHTAKRIFDRLREEPGYGPINRGCNGRIDFLLLHSNESTLCIPSQECLDTQQVVQKLYEWDAKSFQSLAENRWDGSRKKGW